MKLALIHDWLVTFGGAEGLLGELVRCFPDAPVHVLVDFFSAEHHRRLGAQRITTSFVQQLPRADRDYWYYAPLMASAVERFDLRPYQLVLSSSHAFAKGVLVDPDQLHISYVHSPMRFVWDLQTYYLERFGWTRGAKKLAALAAFHYLRLWDARTAHGVDLMIANSKFVRRRILKTYRRRAHIVYPPIDTERFAYAAHKEDFYLAGSFMNPFKRVDLIVEAFRELPTRKLVVFGEGPQLEHCRAIATPNVEFVGRLSDDKLVRYLQAARAFLFAAPEDFGMLMAEAQSCGTPVIAYGKGGAAEIVREQSGVLFGEQSVPALCDAVERFERDRAIHPEHCRASALRFSAPLFRRQISRIVALSWERWQSDRWPDDESSLFAEFAS
jgi:hypothetical protein